MNVRQPAVAGQFYQNDPVQLKAQIHYWLDNKQESPQKTIRAVIVPHAGYIYSGATAAQAYALIKQQQDRIKKVILIGPSHHFYFEGCALPECDQFRTPLGNVAICQEHKKKLQTEPLVVFSDQIHQPEHSLEVQIPFLQSCLDASFVLTPIVTGNIPIKDLADIILPLWQNDTLLVVSSDLSHFHSYAEANEIDQNTCNKIEHYQTSITPHEACGSTGVNTLLLLAEQYHYHIRQLERVNSGDTAGTKSRVVGYASYLITDV